VALLGCLVAVVYLCLCDRGPAEKSLAGYGQADEKAYFCWSLILGTGGSRNGPSALRSHLGGARSGNPRPWPT